MAVQSIQMFDEKNDWREVALCRNTSPELFFPVGNTGNALDSISIAKTVCHRCTAEQECLEYAISSNQDSGVWGGRSEEERREIRRQRITPSRTR